MNRKWIVSSRVVNPLPSSTRVEAMASVTTSSSSKSYIFRNTSPILADPVTQKIALNDAQEVGPDIRQTQTPNEQDGVLKGFW